MGICNEKSNDRELDRKKVGQIRQYEQYNRQRHRLAEQNSVSLTLALRQNKVS